MVYLYADIYQIKLAIAFDAVSLHGAVGASATGGTTTTKVFFYLEIISSYILSRYMHILFLCGHIYFILYSFSFLFTANRFFSFFDKCILLLSAHYPNLCMHSITSCVVFRPISGKNVIARAIARTLKVCYKSSSIRGLSLKILNIVVVKRCGEYHHYLFGFLMTEFNK